MITQVLTGPSCSPLSLKPMDASEAWPNFDAGSHGASISVHQCAELVHYAGGAYFCYDEVSMLCSYLNSTTSCVYRGGEQYNTYELNNSNNAAFDTFFVFGTGSSNLGDCRQELTTSASCPEGWKPGQYDFYKISGGVCEYKEAQVRKIKAGAQCSSWDIFLNWYPCLMDCAAAVQASGRGPFFIYGYGSRAGKCYAEPTASANCPEGWSADLYDFYELIAQVEPNDRVQKVRSGVTCNSPDTAVAFTPQQNFYNGLARRAPQQLYVNLNQISGTV